jgi:hypothetical protein
VLRDPARLLVHHRAGELVVAARRAEDRPLIPVLDDDVVVEAIRTLF